MKKLFQFLGFVILVGVLLVITGCKKKEYITLRGRVIDGTTGLPMKFYPARVYLDDVTKGKLLCKSVSPDLGEFTTDAEGKFIFAYEVIPHCMGGRLVISFNSSHSNFPVNADADTIFYCSSLGTMRIQMNTSMPLGPADTLFMAFSDYRNAKSLMVIDTLINLPVNYIKDYRVRPSVPYNKLRWGRGAKNFVLLHDSTKNLYYYERFQGSLEISVAGDPFISEATANY